MKVILTQDVDRLGKKGEVVTVKDGYARNYLIPKGMALQGTEARLRSIDSIKAELAKKDERHLRKQQKLAEKLATLSLKTEIKMGEHRAFGAITNADIAELLKAAGYEIDRHKIELPNPIKEIGIFDIPVHLGEVTAMVKLWVAPKEQ
ncbi:MAG: 50S ribosomal protein L9 [Candidatus Latescibacteria bacterium]|nr:50S ribosomal protein L9 [Candidatus Latescibacterota bacterium]